MTLSFRIAIVLTGWLGFGCSNLLAEDTQLDEIVVIASKSEQQLRNVSSSVGFLDSMDLETINHTHINESMQRIAGVWISRGNGQEHLTAIRSPVLTGAGGCGAFLMAQDGVSLRASGFCNVNELFEGTTELADRVEVIKGPGSAIHGSNALHGVVNILTKVPEDSLKEIKIEAGPYDYYRTRVAWSNSNTRLDLSGTTDGGYKDDSGFDQQKVLIKHRSEKEDRTINTTFSYTNLNQETAGFIVGDEVYKDSGRKRDNPNPEAYRDARSYRFVSDVTQTAGTGSLTLRPYLRSVDMTFLQHFLPGQAIEENGHDSIGLQTLWVDDNGSWHLGLELEYTQGFLEETQPDVTEGSAFLVETIPAGKHYDYDVDATVAGIFGQYQTDISKALSVTLGLRYEFTQYDYDNRMVDGRTRDDGTSCGFGGCRFNRPADRSDTFNNWSPKLGFIYSFSSSKQLYGQLTRGFRAPQATELYRLQGGQSVTDIDPVELDSLEIGFRGSYAMGRYELSAFAMEKSNFIFRDTSRRNVDNGETSHEGIEFSIVHDFSDTIGSRWSFTYARHQYDNDPALSPTPVKGNDVDTAPRTLGSATLTWTPLARTSIEFEWVHIGEYYEDPQNEHKYEGHDLFHLRSHWQFSDNLSLFARIMNLTDRDYAERADFGFGNDRYFVGTPRSLFVGAKISLGRR